jgi:endonuclease/exonuclease/phosphatase family metal-dependent hydrolase
VAAARNGLEPVDGLREDKGVALLSTLPLSDVIPIELPYEAARRVAVAATIHGSSGDGLRVVSVHFISTSAPARVLTTGNASRLRQGLALADALDRAEAARSEAGRPDAGPTISTVVAGDFNTWSDRETTLRRLRELFPDSPPPLGEGTRGTMPTDHVLFRAAASGSPGLVEGSYRRIENPHRSDHHAVAVRVRFSD